MGLQNLDAQELKMLMAKPQATARKPPLVLPFSGYIASSPTAQGARNLASCPCRLPPEWPPLVPPWPKSGLALYKVLAIHTGVLLGSVFPMEEKTSGYISTRLSLQQQQPGRHSGTSHSFLSPESQPMPSIASGCQGPKET